eukprot:IDg8868t1
MVLPPLSCTVVVGPNANAVQHACFYVQQRLSAP